MKNILCLTVCMLSLLAFASTAQSGGGEASGTFAFDLGTAAGTVNFSGELEKDGTVSGQISFNATVDASGETCQPVNVGTEEQPVYVDVCEPTGNDPENGAVMSRTSVPLNLLIDRMVIADNRAAMSGTIVGDSPFAGQHTILAVESASNNDLFTWGVYKTKTVNTNAKDNDFCQGPPDPLLCENSESCPIPACFCDGIEVNEVCTPGSSQSWTATDYELCLYPPPSDTENFVPADPHNYVCFTGSPDPNGKPAGIPVLATHTITHADSFPLFTYPMTPIPHGGGNKVKIKENK